MSKRAVKFIDEVKALKDSFIRHLHFTVVKDRYSATNRDYYDALASTMWDQLCLRWLQSQKTYSTEDPKIVYFLSMEYNVGRTLSNIVLNAGMDRAVDEAMYQPSHLDFFYLATALSKLGIDIEDLAGVEIDAGLGNGGLGRLAACFLDTLATLGIAAFGYGIRYESGAFHQKIIDGWQIEFPDEWLIYGNPWEKEQPDESHRVSFFGRVIDDVGNQQHGQSADRVSSSWVETDDVIALPYDTPVPGYGRANCNTLRLWSAKAPCNFNFHNFFQGDYISAVLARNQAENISRVLYPIDHVYAGKQLRLKQEYFLVSASIKDIIKRFKSSSANRDLFELPYKAAIHLNDTHPALAIPELMRLLVDEEGLEWVDAWSLCHQTFTHTNHVAQTEALKSWPVAMLDKLLPRIMQIIRRINSEFGQLVNRRWPTGNSNAFDTMSILQGPPEGDQQVVSMDNLCFIGCHRVNSVSQVQTEYLKRVLFKDFARLWPSKLVNHTNGISPRRWLGVCNPGLADLLCESLTIPPNHLFTRLDEVLMGIKDKLDDARLQRQVAHVKRMNKAWLADYLLVRTGLQLDVNSMFDVMVKRVDDYKRHLLLCLYIISLYNKIKASSFGQLEAGGFCPRTFILGGLASPGCLSGKLVIKLINNVARKVNTDPQVSRWLTLVFLPNYRVSVAERVIPAADLSEQIPCVGTEASGTSNMKFMLNGALTIGTRDGSNVELFQEVGPDNAFIFGRSLEEVRALRTMCYNPKRFLSSNPDLKQAIDQLRCNYFNPNQPGLFNDLVKSLVDEDRFLICADFADYVRAQSEAGQAYLNSSKWTRMVLANLASAGRFSSDRTVADYARDMWSVDETRVESSCSVGTDASSSLVVPPPRSAKFYIGGP